MKPITIALYVTKSGRQPFKEWAKTLDEGDRAIIATRLERVKLGNFGDCKTIKGASGLRELRISYGPGYRIYFGLQGETIIILLIGGDKGTQNRDIEKAKKYWLEYKEK